MEAGKKPMHEIKGADLGIDFIPVNQIRALKGFVMNRKNIILNQGSAADEVKELAAALRKEGVL
jgi:electron transfer flavoprotein beta subunit